MALHFDIFSKLHDKTGKPIWVLTPTEKLSKDEYEWVKLRAVKANGYYSKFVTGFVFKYDPSDLDWVKDIYSGEAVAEPQMEQVTIIQKLNLIQLGKGNRKPRKDIILAEIEAGKMEYLTFKVWDSMSESDDYPTVTEADFKPAEGNKELMANLKSAIGQQHWTTSVRIEHTQEFGYYIQFMRWYIRYKKPKSEGGHKEKIESDDQILKMVEKANEEMNGLISSANITMENIKEKLLEINTTIAEKYPAYYQLTKDGKLEKTQYVIDAAKRVYDTASEQFLSNLEKKATELFAGKTIAKQPEKIPGGKSSGKPDNTLDLQEYVNTITFNDLFNGSEIPEAFFESYEKYVANGQYPYNESVAKFYAEDLHLVEDIDKLKTIVYWVSQHRREKKQNEQHRQMKTEGWLLMDLQSAKLLSENHEKIIITPEINGVSEFEVVKGLSGGYLLKNSRQKTKGYSLDLIEPEKFYYYKLKNAKSSEKIKGGLGSDKPDSDFDPASIAKGAKVEMEHTTDPAIAKGIAKDHLTEDAKYYDKLEIVESGVLSKPTTNSLGHPIADTVEKIANFWLWFGNSKVKDSQGRPLVIYHGTTKEFNFFDPTLKGSRGSLDEKYFTFTSNRDVAEYYGKGYVGKDTPIVMPVYLKIENMPEYDNEKKYYNKLEVWAGYKWIQIHQLQDFHKNGFEKFNERPGGGIIKFEKVDGFVVRNTIEKEQADIHDFNYDVEKAEAHDKEHFVGDTYYVLNPEQIKSVDCNSGLFSPENPDICDTVKESDSRPTTNSKGQPIHSTPEGIANFWKWFDGSKAVDDKGLPLVLYHGTVADFSIFKKGRKDPWGSHLGMYFSISPVQASKYAESYHDDEGTSSVLPVYLSLKNPKIIDVKTIEMSNPGGDMTGLGVAIQNAKKIGNDGVIIENFNDYGGSDIQYVVFSPTQIKSTICDSGLFSPENPDICDTVTETEKVEEPKEAENPVTLDEIRPKPEDLSYTLAKDAYRAISFDPEKRAKQEQDGYVDDVNDFIEQLTKIATSDVQKQELINQVQNYKKGYLSKYGAVLSAKGRTMSSMITGASKFPVERNQKALDTEHNRSTEFFDWKDKFQSNAIKAINNLKTPEQKDNERWKSIKKTILNEVATIIAIDRGTMPGMDRSAFTNSLKRFLTKLANNGQIDDLKQSIALIREIQAKEPKPIFSAGNAIWTLAETIEAKPEQPKETPVGGVIAAYDGATIENNTDEERVQLLFDQKPSVEIMDELKHNGWHWSPTNNAWQRKNTQSAIYDSRRILDKHFTRIEENAAETEQEKVSDEWEPWNMTFDEFFQYSREEKLRGYKNREIARQDYDLSILRHLFEDEIRKDNFGRGIAKKIADINACIGTNGSKTNIEHLGEFKNADSVIKELYAQALAEGKQIPEQAINNPSIEEQPAESEKNKVIQESHQGNTGHSNSLDATVEKFANGDYRITDDDGKIYELPNGDFKELKINGRKATDSQKHTYVGGGIALWHAIECTIHDHDLEFDEEYQEIMRLGAQEKYKKAIDFITKEPTVLFEAAGKERNEWVECKIELMPNGYVRIIPLVLGVFDSYEENQYNYPPEVISSLYKERFRLVSEVRKWKVEEDAEVDPDPDNATDWSKYHFVEKLIGDKKQTEDSEKIGLRKFYRELDGSESESEFLRLCKPEFIGRFENKEDGLVAIVTFGANGYHVSLTDVDANQVVPSITIYKDKDQAIEKAKSLVKRTAKEPWEMTKDEWFIYKFNKLPKVTQAKIKNAEKGYANIEEIREQTDREHWGDIKDAMDTGKFIPPEVLAEYPEPMSTPELNEPEYQWTASDGTKYWVELNTEDGVYVVKSHKTGQPISEVSDSGYDSRGDAEDMAKSLAKGIVKEISKTFLREQDGLKIYLLDGEAVRKQHIEYVAGGHGYVYDWIPTDEVWIDENQKDKPIDMEATIRHELFEINLMKQGMDYDEAHEKANEHEAEYRKELLPKAEEPIEIKPDKIEIGFKIKDKNGITYTIDRIVDGIAIATKDRRGYGRGVTYTWLVYYHPERDEWKDFGDPWQATAPSTKSIKEALDIIYRDPVADMSSNTPEVEPIKEPEVFVFYTDAPIQYDSANMKSLYENYLTTHKGRYIRKIIVQDGIKANFQRERYEKDGYVMLNVTQFNRELFTGEVFKEQKYTDAEGNTYYAEPNHLDNYKTWVAVTETDSARELYGEWFEKYEDAIEVAKMLSEGKVPLRVEDMDRPTVYEPNTYTGAPIATVERWNLTKPDDGVLNWEKSGGLGKSETINDLKGYVVGVSRKFDFVNRPIGANLTISKRNPDQTLKILKILDYGSLEAAKKDALNQVRLLEKEVVEPVIEPVIESVKQPEPLFKPGDAVQVIDTELTVIAGTYAVVLLIANAKFVQIETGSGQDGTKYKPYIDKRNLRKVEEGVMKIEGVGKSYRYTPQTAQIIEPKEEPENKEGIRREKIRLGTTNPEDQIIIDSVSWQEDELQIRYDGDTKLTIITDQDGYFGSGWIDVSKFRKPPYTINGKASRQNIKAEIIRLLNTREITDIILPATMFNAFWLYYRSPIAEVEPKEEPQIIKVGSRVEFTDGEYLVYGTVGKIHKINGMAYVLGDNGDGYEFHTEDLKLTDKPKPEVIIGNNNILAIGSTLSFAGNQLLKPAKMKLTEVTKLDDGRFSYLFVGGGRSQWLPEDMLLKKLKEDGILPTKEITDPAEVEVEPKEEPEIINTEGENCWGANAPGCETLTFSNRNDREAWMDRFGDWKKTPLSTQYIYTKEGLEYYWSNVVEYKNTHVSKYCPIIYTLQTEATKEITDPAEVEETFHLKELETKVNPNFTYFKTLNFADYKDAYLLNKAIEELLDSKPDDNTFTLEEKAFISGYTGYGGLDKLGEKYKEVFNKGSFTEFYTPEDIVQQMWELAYEYGYTDDQPVLETSAGIGVFLKYAPDKEIVTAVEMNKYSGRILKILYDKATVLIQKFEQLFINNRDSARGNTKKFQIPPIYGLVIGNPPYGEWSGFEKGMGEGTYTGARNLVEYFITRGLDMLKPGGLLIYIEGANPASGGVPFLQTGISNCKKKIAEKADLIDFYRLPNGVFERTDVTSEIIVFRKK
jgi:hypothetical protein